MWRDIALANREALLATSKFISSSSPSWRAPASGDGAEIERIFEAARSARNAGCATDREHAAYPEY